MPSFELNKVLASVLLAILVCMIAGNFADILYTKNAPALVRGFVVRLNNVLTANNSAQPEDVKIDIPALMAKANVDAGKEVAKKCIACHNVGENQPNKIGPHLWDTVGRNKASIDDYHYSGAMQNKGGKWDYENLFAFLANPSAYIPGTKMTFAGLNKPEDIANIIAFLRAQSHNPIPLP